MHTLCNSHFDLNSSQNFNTLVTDNVSDQVNNNFDKSYKSASKDSPVRESVLNRPKFFSERFPNILDSNNQLYECNFLAGNLQGARAANSLFTQTILDRKINIALIQDAFVVKDRIFGFPLSWSIVSSFSNKAHIAIITKLRFTLLFKRELIVAITIFTDVGSINIGCAYVPPRADFENFLQTWDEDMSHYPGLWIIHGDFNAHSPFWNCRDEDDRGELLLDFAAKYNLFLVNPPNSQPTVVVPRGVGYTDLTWTSMSLESLLVGWTVLEEFTASDHRHIFWTLKASVPLYFIPRLKTKFVPERCLSSAFQEAFSLEKLALPDSYSSTHSFSKLLIRVIDISMSVAITKCRLKTASTKFKLTWWNNDLLLQRKKLKALYRRYIRSSDEDRLHNKLAYYSASAKYKQNINLAKTTAWRDFCTKTSSPFDVHYKLLRDKLRKPLILPPLYQLFPNDISCAEVFSHLFPGSTMSQILNQVRDENFTLSSSVFPKLTIDEIIFALKSITPNKAPGPYGLDAKILYCIFLAWPDFFVSFYNFVFTSGYIPSFLKISNLILLTKPNKSPSSPKAYRPICLIPYFSKLLDKLILYRLLFFLHNFSPISSRQFGFMETRNTEQALHFLLTTVQNFRNNYKYSAIIAADISAAFDSIRFKDIFYALKSRGLSSSFVHLIMNFVTGRYLIFNHPFSTVFLRMVKGVPQGSSTGPILWNLVLESLLNLPLPSNIVVSAYADDINFVIAANSRSQLESVGRKALMILYYWTLARGLTISVDKTQILLMFKTAKLKRPPYFYLNDKKNSTVKTLRILGLYIDSHLNWISHAQHLRRVLHDLAFKILSFSRTGWGISADYIKIWYLTVAERIMVYAAPVWAYDHSHPSISSKIICSTHNKS